MIKRHHISLKIQWCSFRNFNNFLIYKPSLPCFIILLLSCLWSIWSFSIFFHLWRFNFNQNISLKRVQIWFARPTWISNGGFAVFYLVHTLNKQKVAKWPSMYWLAHTCWSCSCSHELIELFIFFLRQPKNSRCIHIFYQKSWTFFNLFSYTKKHELGLGQTSYVKMYFKPLENM